MTRYQLSLRAEKLPGGMCRRPNPFAVVTVTEGARAGLDLGETETIVGSRDPDWSAVLYAECTEAEITKIDVEVWDKTGEGREDKLIGTAKFEITGIAQSAGREQRKELDGGGAVLVSADESPKGSSTGHLSLHLRGLDVKNVEPGILGLGRTDPFYEIAKKHADHAVGSVRWNTVFRSDHIDNHLNPFWEPMSIGLEELCYCDLNWPLRISVKDWQASGKHRLVGQFETTVQTLMDHVAIRGNADRETAFEIFDGDISNSRGLIVVLKAERFTLPSDESTHAQ